LKKLDVQKKIDFYFVYMGLYLIKNQIYSARHLWRRGPDDIKNMDNSFTALWTVGEHLFKRELKLALMALSREWPLFSIDFINDLRRAITLLQNEMIVRTYSVINMQVLHELLGSSSQDELLQSNLISKNSCIFMMFFNYI